MLRGLVIYVHVKKECHNTWYKLHKSCIKILDSSLKSLVFCRRVQVRSLWRSAECSRRGARLPKRAYVGVAAGGPY